MALEQFNLEGQVAIVTGAGKGVGQGIARVLAEAGATVVGTARTESDIRGTIAGIEDAGGRGLALVADAMSRPDSERVVSTAMKSFGRIDILVNNVGGSAPGGAAEMPEDTFDKQIDYNLKSVFLACRHVIPIMIEQRGGAIVNTASTSGTLYSGSPQIGYASSKAAVISLTQSAGLDLIKHRINVNAIAPGVVDNEHWDHVDAMFAKYENLKPGEKKRVKAALARKRNRKKRSRDSAMDQTR